MDKLTKQLPNSEIALIAIKKAGGDEKLIDLEDAYWACWEIVPHKFSWRTRKDTVDREKCFKAFDHFKPGRNNKYDDPDKNPVIAIWKDEKIRLSKIGINWLKENKGLVEELLGSNSQTKNIYSSNKTFTMLNRFKNHDVYKEWISNSKVSNRKWEVAAALQCPLSSSKDQMMQRVEILKADAEILSETEVTKFLDMLVKNNTEWFKGGF